MEVVGTEAPVPLGGPKQRCVLAMLALSANRVVASDRLVAGVWGDDAREKSSGTLQVYISTLRRALTSTRSGSSVAGPAICSRSIPRQPAARTHVGPADGRVVPQRSASRC